MLHFSYIALFDWKPEKESVRFDKTCFPLVCKISDSIYEYPAF